MFLKSTKIPIKRCVTNQGSSNEMTARSDDTSEKEEPSSVHSNFAGIEDNDNFVEMVNG